MSSMIRQEIKIRTGTFNGQADYLTAGFVTEERFTKDNVRKRVWLHISCFNPVLVAQMKPFLGGASYVCLEPSDLPRGKAGPASPPVLTSEGEQPPVTEGYEPGCED